MRLERLGNLFSPRRLRRAFGLLDAPLATHLRLSGLGKGTIALRGRDGGAATCPDYRTFRHFWRFLCEAEGHVALKDGYFEFDHAGRRFALRTNSSDFRVFEEIVLEDVYGVAGLTDLDAVVDLGGNIGLFSATMAPRARRVVMVEPVPANLEVARRNLAGSGAGDRVTVVPGVVSARTGERVRLHLSESAGMNSALPEVAGNYSTPIVGALDVEGVSLEDLFARHGIERCSLLKCDIEGAEHEALMAAPLEVLRRVDRLVMEVHVTAQDGEAGRRLFAHLAAAGLPMVITDGTIDPPPPGRLNVALARGFRAP